jgi:thiazole synthase ThiGH ThiG subunit
MLARTEPEVQSVTESNVQLITIALKSEQNVTKRHGQIWARLQHMETRKGKQANTHTRIRKLTKKKTK